MTVKLLIAKLQSLPEQLMDVEVLREDNSGGYETTHEVRVEEVREINREDSSKLMVVIGD